MSKKSRFRRPFHNQHGKRSETLLKSARQHLCYNYELLWKKLCWRKSLWVICKISGLFVNTFSTDDKYSVLNRNNLTPPIQMQLSKKQKPFSRLFYELLKCTQNFKQFEKKDAPHSLCIFENTDYKIRR